MQPQTSSLRLRLGRQPNPLVIGTSYFYNSVHKIVTTSDIRSPLILDTLVSALTILDVRLNTASIVLPSSTEIVIDVIRTSCSSSPPAVSYYLVDHQQRTQFWLEDVDIETLECPPVMNHDHLSKSFPPFHNSQEEFVGL